MNAVAVLTLLNHAGLKQLSIRSWKSCQYNGWQSTHIVDESRCLRSGGCLRQFFSTVLATAIDSSSHFHHSRPEIALQPHNHLHQIIINYRINYHKLS